MKKRRGNSLLNFIGIEDYSGEGLPQKKIQGKEVFYDLLLLIESSQLTIIMKRVREKFEDVSEILTYFDKKFRLKDKKDKDYLKRALNAYWEEDYLVASHLFIPFIEYMIRELVSELDENILKQYEKVSDYISITTLLKEETESREILNKHFSEISEDICDYFERILTKKGWNLRNYFAHGVDKKKFFENSSSDRLFHILIVLSLAEAEKKDIK